MRWAVAVLVVGACAADSPPPDEPVDCSKVTGVDTFVVGLERTGVTGVFDFRLMSVNPAPPGKGDNTWVVEVRRGDVPVDGAELRAEPCMKEHCTPKDVVITPGPAAGQYQLAPVNMWMPGVWSTLIEVTQGASTDTVVYKFCIPE